MKAQEVLKKCKERFINDKNVVGIGLGVKDDKEVIVILVTKKENIARKIPKKFEDLDVEIREVGEIKAL